MSIYGKGIYGKLINILLRSSSNTSPKILAFRNHIKTLEIKNAVYAFSLEHAHTFFYRHVFCFISLKLQESPWELPPEEQWTVATHPRLSHAPVFKGFSFASVTYFWVHAVHLPHLFCPCDFLSKKAKTALWANCSKWLFKCTLT